jgi:hypothetical protein
MVIAIYGNRMKSHDHINNISELSSKNQSEWYITSHKLANLMVITIYSNSMKSHDHINDISELSSKNQSE